MNAAWEHIHLNYADDFVRIVRSGADYTALNLRTEAPSKE